VTPLTGTALAVATALDVFLLGGIQALGSAYPAWQPETSIAFWIATAVFGALGVGQATVQVRAHLAARAAAAKNVGVS
jgi:hypothetical protein